MSAIEGKGAKIQLTNGSVAAVNDVDSAPRNERIVSGMPRVACKVARITHKPELSHVATETATTARIPHEIACSKEIPTEAFCDSRTLNARHLIVSPLPLMVFGILKECKACDHLMCQNPQIAP